MKLLNNVINPLTLTDFYKWSHLLQYPPKTEMVYATWTPRGAYDEEIKKVVVFGPQATMQKLKEIWDEGFFNRPCSVVTQEFIDIHTKALLTEPRAEWLDAIIYLHSLGHLPLKVLALPEGTRCPLRTPYLTIHNTDPKCAWLTNFIETMLSTDLWLPATSATWAYELRSIVNKFAKQTGLTSVDMDFMLHDFSMRGMSNLEAGAASGAAHLLSSCGTDTISSFNYIKAYYDGELGKDYIAGSVPATEHSVMCAWGKRDEKDLFQWLATKQFPTGFLSVVSDTWDLWKVVGEYLPVLKDEILARDGRLVIRPDSGDPVDIVCGTAIIKDLTDRCNTLIDCQRWMKVILEGNIQSDTPHGECGASEIEGFFKFQGKTYNIKFDIIWNRHDYQYYFIDEFTIDSCEEVQLTPEQKGLIESLWDIFGGTINDMGYRTLDIHIGAIYGDAINKQRLTAILTRLRDKGFAANNCVFGIGSFTYQYNTRDTFGFALKSTAVVVDGEFRQIFKDPKTDSGLKKSQKGMVVVNEDLTYTDELNKDDLNERYFGDMLNLIFYNGKFCNFENYKDIRERLWSQD